MCFQTEMTGSHFHATGTPVKCNVCVRVGAGQSTDMKYSHCESSPPTYPEVHGCQHGALSPGSAGEGAQWEAAWPREETEQTMAAHLIPAWAGGRCPVIHVVLSNHQLVPERKWKDKSAHT